MKKSDIMGDGVWLLWKFQIRSSKQIQNSNPKALREESNDVKQDDSGQNNVYQEITFDLHYSAYGFAQIILLLPCCQKCRDPLRMVVQQNYWDDQVQG